MRQPDEHEKITSCEKELFALDCSDHFTPVAFVQAWYYLVTGVWPLVNISSFQLVTGPKTDLWLVKTVGVLVTVISVTLLIAAYRQRTDEQRQSTDLGKEAERL